MLHKRYFAPACCLFLCLAVSVSQVIAQETSTDSTPVSAESLLRGITDYLGERPRYACTITTVMEVSMGGRDEKMELITDFRIERPNRFAIQLRSGVNGITSICDGETIATHLPITERFFVDEAPKDIESAFNGSSETNFIRGMSGPGGSAFPIGGDAYYTIMMEGVNDSKYLGEQELDGVKCHHCRFEQDGISWELWSEQGAHPVPRKILFDLPEESMPAGAKMSMYTVFTDWDLNPTFTDDDFRFDPPTGAEEVDDQFALLGDMGDLFSESENQPHPLLGKAAPAFDTDNLQGDAIDLKDRFGKSIVILDFWATWCPPCVEALPKIASVAKEYEDRNVKFFAVNVAEDVETIREFLEASDLDIDVLMDPDGEISSLYQANAIPQTVIVGLGSKVQVVHVGMGANMQKQLSGELDRLLDGDDLAQETLDAAEEAKELATVDDFGTSPVWNHPGTWAGVATDHASGRIFATDSAGQLVVLDKQGSELESTNVAQGGKIRLASLLVGGDPEVVVYGPWGRSVQAFTLKGVELWDYTVGQGTDDVWAADLNGDGADEVIIGYNGGTGLHVLDQQGTLLWKYTEIGNVWHVTAGDVDGDDEPEVVTTSATGQVHIFSADGKKEKDIPLAVYASMVRTSKARPGAPSKILVAGSGEHGEEFVSVSASGDTDFELTLPIAGTPHADEMKIASSRPWAAVAMRGGRVNVIDLDAGAVIATVSDQGQTPDVAWLSRENDSPLLVVATGRGINTFEVNPDAETSED